MPAIVIAAAVVATLSAAPPARATASVQKVCGMKMIIGDASVDRGILIGAAREEKAAWKPREDDSCGSVKLVKPVRRQR